VELSFVVSSRHTVPLLAIVPIPSFSHQSTLLSPYSCSIRISSNASVQILLSGVEVFGEAPLCNKVWSFVSLMALLENFGFAIDGIGLTLRLYNVPMLLSLSLLLIWFLCICSNTFLQFLVLN